MEGSRDEAAAVQRSSDGALTSGHVAAASASASATRPGFFRRHRLPLALGLVALCLYAGSILYILFGRGQIV